KRTSNHSEPRLRPALAEGHVLQIGTNLDAPWFDGFDVPTVSEGGVQLFLRNAPRPLRPWLLVAEAQQEQSAAGLEHSRQPLDIAAAVVVAEDVQQAAVRHIVDPLGPVLERHGALDEERGL